MIILLGMKKQGVGFEMETPWADGGIYNNIF